MVTRVTRPMPSVFAYSHLVYTAKHHPISLKWPEICTPEHRSFCLHSSAAQIARAASVLFTPATSHREPHTLACSVDYRPGDVMMEPKIVNRLEGRRAHSPVRRREQQPIGCARERPTLRYAGAHLGAAKLGKLDIAPFLLGPSSGLHACSWLELLGPGSLPLGPA